MTLLSLDTNTEMISCSISNKEFLLSETNLYNNRKHSINSINIIDLTLKNSNLELKDIDGFVLSKGPGGFTGLRIAFSIIKSFSFSLNKPIISISSLDSLCFRENFDGIVCSIIDALRDEIYINSFSSKEEIIRNTYDGDIIHINEIKNYLENKHKTINNILFTGYNLSKFECKIKSLFSNCYMNKKLMTSYDYAILGLEKAKLNLFDDNKTSVPSYIRVSQAQENLINKK